jgi:hypothetical protein
MDHREHRRNKAEQTQVAHPMKHGAGKHGASQVSRGYFFRG